MIKLEQNVGVSDEFDKIVELAKKEQDPYELRRLLAEYQLEHKDEVSKEKSKRNSRKLSALSRAIRAIEAKLRGSSKNLELGKGDKDFLKGKQREK